VIHKITAFITRKTKSGYYLLLLEHPTAGIQSKTLPQVIL